MPRDRNRPSRSSALWLNVHAHLHSDAWLQALEVAEIASAATQAMKLLEWLGEFLAMVLSPLMKTRKQEKDGNVVENVDFQPMFFGRCIFHQ